MGKTKKNVNEMNEDEIKKAFAQGKIQRKKIDDDVQQFLDDTANNRLDKITEVLQDDEKKAKLLNQHDANRRTALHFACHNGNIETFDLLINAKPDLNQQDFDNYTPLMLAIKMGNTKLAERLIQLGAQLDLTNKDGFTAVQLAVLSGETDIVRLLLQRGAEVSTESTESGCILHAACGIKKEDLEIIDMLVSKYPKLLSVMDGNEMTPLHIAIAYGNTDLAKELIKLGANVNAVAVGGCTPLHICVDSGNVEVIKALIENGATLKLDMHGETPLLMAQNSKNKTLEQLLESVKLDPTPYKPKPSAKGGKKASEPKVSAEDLKENGNKAFRNGDYDIALNWYQLAGSVEDVTSEMNPGVKKQSIAHVLFSNKSACHLHLKNYQQALADAEETIKLAPNWPKGYLRKAGALEALGRQEEAQEAKDKMTALESSAKN
ncbi:hypothetical protein SAMD00019534_053770 [Acytostelium subglobosum LB1]|uniref:hypothetical protein n=1 Tax=Acytostelium subglobosum LB1 TaxID=1410327 RepID=UPI000644C059|nr:hypothetical protein SAMD00019534_053770 [Acytostelium subglobosum LB1]GAM22202.1 hypothetical protein SAMD00019534_053770 [Acytostelium subglobosum LB1]|eukprot:XP_012755302.1 hypothetical protein SAMD00019534_053770 [Acytostelium subglobosum LB1]